jgi:hypothetical protein
LLDFLLLALACFFFCCSSSSSWSACISETHTKQQSTIIAAYQL